MAKDRAPVRPVRPARPQPARRPAQHQPLFRGLVLVPCFLLLTLVIWAGDRRALWVYLLASLATGLMFYIDKRRAETDGQRIAENTLLGASLMGGWPGALIVGQLIRHKTRKLSFRLPLWGVVAVHLGLWGWLLADGGAFTEFTGRFPPH